jgi:hypothetical protein
MEIAIIAGILLMLKALFAKAGTKSTPIYPTLANKPTASMCEGREEV